VLVWYRVWETEENGKGSGVKCAGLVQGGGDGGKWKGFSADVWWFGTGCGRRKEMERVQWCVLVCYSVGETEVNGKCSVAICAGLVQRGGDGRKLKGFSGDVWWFDTEWGRRREMERVQW
jgi:hypothetical protein